jgi:DNA-binding transcriptional regulator YhcF (GntR family)
MGHRRAAVIETLRQRIVAGLHLGALRPGDRLPSLRQLSAELHSNPRLIMAAYRQLASEGLVRLRPRSGIFVEAYPRPPDELLPEVGAWVVDLLLRGLSCGMRPTDLARRVRACLDTARIRALCLECNDDQIQVLCRQARDDFGFVTDALDADVLARREPLPASAASADLILTTRFHVDEAQRLGRRLRRPVIVVTLDRIFLTEIERVLSEGPVWWICSDARFAAKLPSIFPGAALTPVVLGRDELESVPAAAVVYATPPTAERLPAGWHEGGVVTVPRIFSADTARALITFFVRRNLEKASEAASGGSDLVPGGARRGRRSPTAVVRGPTGRQRKPAKQAPRRSRHMR